MFLLSGLLGITLDRSDIFLVSIKETISNGLKEATSAARAEKHKAERNAPSSPTSAKRRRMQDRDDGSTDSPQSTPAKRRNDDDSGHERLQGGDENVKVKTERNQDSNQDSDNEDGRKYNPAYDATVRYFCHRIYSQTILYVCR